MGKKKGAGVPARARAKSALLLEMERVGKLYGDLEPGLRKDVLGLVADLRTRWLELGRKLEEVKRESEWIGWGHLSWEDYCANELKMKAATAQTMIDAYEWIRDSHPEIAKVQDPKWLPDAQAVAGLANAELKLIRSGRWDEEARRRVHEVDAKIVGGELDGAEARKAVRELTAKPRKEKKPSFSLSDDRAERGQKGPAGEPPSDKGEKGASAGEETDETEKTLWALNQLWRWTLDNGPLGQIRAEMVTEAMGELEARGQ